MFWRHVTEANFFRRDQDILKTSSSRRMSAAFKSVIVSTDIIDDLKKEK